jgi:hypothetical protein
VKANSPTAPALTARLATSDEVANSKRRRAVSRLTMYMSSIETDFVNPSGDV